MTIDIKLVTKKPAASQLHAIIVPSNRINELPNEIDVSFLESRQFDGGSGQMVFTQSLDGQVALLGVGSTEDLDHQKYRQAGAVFLREVKNFKSVSSLEAKSLFP